MTADGQNMLVAPGSAAQKTASEGKPVATRRGMPVYKVNPSIPATNGLATRQKRIEVPGGKASVILDNPAYF